MTKLDADDLPFLPHLIPHVTDRGFVHLPPIEGSYPGDNVRVYESSAATEAFIWVRAKQAGHVGEAAVHLGLAEAAQLRDQLAWMIDNHYQVKPR